MGKTPVVVLLFALGWMRAVSGAVPPGLSGSTSYLSSTPARNGLVKTGEWAVPRNIVWAAWLRMNDSDLLPRRMPSNDAVPRPLSIFYTQAGLWLVVVAMMIW